MSRRARIYLFAFTHLLYSFHLGTTPAGLDPPLTLPLFYVLAVSFYTTLNFALWPDLSTPKNIGLHAGWLADPADRSRPG